MLKKSVGESFVLFIRLYDVLNTIPWIPISLLEFSAELFFIVRLMTKILCSSLVSLNEFLDGFLPDRRNQTYLVIFENSYILSSNFLLFYREWPIPALKHVLPILIFVPFIKCIYLVHNIDWDHVRYHIRVLCL